MASLTTRDAVPLTKPGTDTLAAVREQIAARMEALPVSSWHLKARVIVGSATFFDAIDAVAIGMILPVGLGAIALIAAFITAAFAVETRRRVLEEVSP